MPVFEYIYFQVYITIMAISPCSSLEKSMSTETFKDVCEVCHKAVLTAGGVGTADQVQECTEYKDIETGEVHTLCLPHAKEWRRADNAAAEAELAYWDEDED